MKVKRAAFLALAGMLMLSSAIANPKRIVNSTNGSREVLVGRSNMIAYLNKYNSAEADLFSKGDVLTDIFEEFIAQTDSGYAMQHLFVHSDGFGVLSILVIADTQAKAIGYYDKLVRTNAQYVPHYAGAVTTLKIDTSIQGWQPHSTNYQVMADGKPYGYMAIFRRGLNVGIITTGGGHAPTDSRQFLEVARTSGDKMMSFSPKF